MNTTQAIEILEGMQKRIICGSNTFGEIAEVIKAQEAAMAKTDCGKGHVPKVELPNIGPDPLKLDGEERRARYSVEACKEQLTEAHCVQQKGIPDQTALVWRADLMKVLDDHTWRTAQAKSLLEERGERQAKLERVKDETDEEWLDAISANWKILTGELWETRDGECREEGVQRNVSAIFQHFEEWLSPEKTKVLKDALHKLARLGNGPLYGNSTGNEIAQQALRETGLSDV